MIPERTDFENPQPECSLAVSVRLEEGASEIGCSGLGIAIENPEALFSVAIAHDGKAVAKRLRNVILEDERVLALVTVRIDDKMALEHGCLLGPVIAG